jgi:hypothetical protein
VLSANTYICLNIKGPGMSCSCFLSLFTDPEAWDGWHFLQLLDSIFALGGSGKFEGVVLAAHCPERHANDWSSSSLLDFSDFSLWLLDNVRQTSPRQVLFSQHLHHYLDRMETPTFTSSSLPPSFSFHTLHHFFPLQCVQVQLWANEE